MNVTPSAKVMRPTTRLVTVAVANHSDPKRADEPNSYCTRRSKSTADTTPHSAPSATGPMSEPSTGDRTL